MSRERDAGKIRQSHLPSASPAGRPVLMEVRPGALGTTGLGEMLGGARPRPRGEGVSAGAEMSPSARRESVSFMKGGGGAGVGGRTQALRQRTPPGKGAWG